MAPSPAAAAWWKSGTGTLTLSGANTYTGGTSVTGGTLSISNDAALGGASGGVSLNGGTLQFASATTSARAFSLGSSGGTLDSDGGSNTVSGAISGSGGLIIADSSTGRTGVIILSGANSYTGGTTVSGGVLQLGAANALPSAGTVTLSGGSINFNGFSQTLNSLSGSGNISLGAASLTVNQSGNTTYTGVISGTGSLVQTGSGTLILDGANTYTGGTTIKGGVLEVGDAGHPGAVRIQGPVAVGSGGTLSGHGTINGSVSIAAGGALQPGGTVGTLNVVGNTGFAPGATYVVETSGNQADLLNATGTVTITGANLKVVEDTANTLPSASYTIITAGGGVTGTFASVSSSMANVTPFVSYGSNAVNLTLLRNDLQFGSFGTTANQTAVGTAVSAAGVGSALYRSLALVANNAANMPAALNSLSGEIHASLRSALIQDDRTIRTSLLGHMDHADGDGFAVWGAPFVSCDQLSGDGNAGDLHHNNTGIIFGADMAAGFAGNLRVGLAGAFTEQKIQPRARASTANGNSGHAAVYADWSDDVWVIKAGGELGRGYSNVSRSVSFTGDTDTSRQTHTSAQVFGDAGYNFTFRGTAVEPYADLAWISVQTGGFSETGGATTALSGSSGSDSSAYSTLGLRFVPGSIPMGDDIQLVPHLDLGWQHAFNTIRPGELMNFAATGSAFAVAGVPLDQDAAAPQVTFDLQLPSGIDLSLGYDGLISGKVQDHTVEARLNWAL